ncbi:MAG: glycosyltransferase [Methanomassiliicoccales archaeon]|nr:glycosyltransferase [Methanomassiliicoccales archaeon]
MSANRVAAVIPAFNEELTIGSVVLETRKHVDQVIVVNDGSFDRTSEIARLAGAYVVDLPKNGGKAAALRKGIEIVRSQGYDACVFLDGDGQHDPDEIPRIIEPVLRGEADLVIGSRFLNSNGSTPSYRKVGQRILNIVTNMGVKQKISDSQSGFRALSASAIENFNFHSRGYAIESDMILHLSGKGMRIKEVPISSRYDVPEGHKKKPFAHGLEVFARVLRLVTQKRPLLIIGVPGFVIFLAGLLLGILSLFEHTLFGWGWMFQTSLALFLFIIGMVLGISAVTLNSIAQMFGGGIR